MTAITGGPSPSPAPCYTTSWHSTMDRNLKVAHLVQPETANPQDGRARTPRRRKDHPPHTCGPPFRFHRPGALFVEDAPQRHLRLHPHSVPSRLVRLKAKERKVYTSFETCHFGRGNQTMLQGRHNLVRQRPRSDLAVRLLERYTRACPPSDTNRGQTSDPEGLPLRLSCHGGQGVQTSDMGHRV